MFEKNYPIEEEGGDVFIFFSPDRPLVWIMSLLFFFSILVAVTDQSALRVQKVGIFLFFRLFIPLIFFPANNMYQAADGRVLLNRGTEKDSFTEGNVPIKIQ